MSKRFKDFGGTENVNAEPLSFRLHGEEFHCHPMIQGRNLLSIVANTNEEDGVAVAKTIDSFIETCLVPESLERFKALTSDPKRIVTVETLGEIVGWLVEQYAARPTQQPEASSSGE